MGEVKGLSVRPVGFRSGTDAELTALHAIAAPVEAERRPDLAPQPLDAYVAFARQLPSHFDDHAWLIDDLSGDPIASGFCWSNAAGDDRVMECDVLVARAHRRRGCGTRLLQAICDETEDAGRSRLTWSTFDAVPAGDAFSRRIGARVARVNETSQLRLADVDWAMVERWRAAERARELGYHLELLAGPIPERRRADAVVFHHIMQTAPRDELDVGDVLIGEDFVVELDRLLEAIGRTHWTVFVRDAAGTCVGGTEVFFEAWEPEAVLQQNTGIDPAHRGLGLAKWAKAEMLDWVRRDRPLAERVRTGNASSNAAMLAINHALGFRTINVRTEWQVELDAVRRAVS